MGRNIPNAPSGTTEKNKLRDAVSNIKLYLSENVIAGLSIDWDSSVKSKLISPKYTNPQVAINLNLAPLTVDSKKGTVNSSFRDYVTHIFGSYSGKMECLGFKTSNGKFYKVGNCKVGTPFVIGKYGEKFHGMKIGLKDGISSITPQFKKGWFLSPVPANDDDYHEEELIDDEVQCQNLTGSELEYALYYFDEDEKMFPVSDPIDTPNGESYDKVVYGEEQTEKIPPSQFFTTTDFSTIKKKVQNVVKPTKNQKQIQEEEKKRQEFINTQVQEHEKLKKKKEDEYKSKLDKPISIAEKITKGTNILFGQEISKGTFNDKFFPNDSRCLFGITGSRDLPENVTPDEVEDWDKIVWARAKDIFETDHYQVFVENVEPDDILQGTLGNCYFLSAIATIAEESPETIKRRFLFASRSNEGLYGVWIKKCGVWKLVLLDDYFPCMKNDDKVEFAFTRAHGSELWVVLLEKVWAKLCGGYVNIIGGMPNEVFNTFTSAFTDNINLNSVQEEILWQKLLEGESKSFLMSAGTGEIGEDRGLTPGHAYSLLRAKEVLDRGLKTRLVELRNPWGEGEWTGDWSDNSSKWTKQLKEECKLMVAAKNGTEDGRYWMNLKDFLNYFVVCNISKYHKGFYDVQVKYSNNQTNQHNVSLLTVEEDSLCYVQIHQKYKRFVLKDGSHPQQTIINLMVVDENFNYLESVYSKENIDCVQIKLKKGNYYVLSDINYRFELMGKPHGYSISCYSEKICKLEIAKDLNGDEVFKKALISYARLKLKPIIPQEMIDKNRQDAKCYKRCGTNPFPGHLYVFENMTSDLVFDASIRMGDCENAGIYDFSTHNFINDSHRWSLEVHPNTTEVVYIKFATNDTRISYIEEKSVGEYCNMSLRESQEMIEASTWERGQKNEIDKNCGIWEYTLQHKKGFGIGFENKSKKRYRIDVEWELSNLYHLANRGENTLQFDLEPGSRHFSFLAISNPNIQSSYEEGLGFEVI